MTTSPPHPHPRPVEGAAAISRRLISLVGVLSVLAGLAKSWSAVSTLSAAAGAVMTVGFLAALGAAVAAMTVRRTRSLDRLDCVVLATGIALWAVEHLSMVRPGYGSGNDETALGSDALRALLRGDNFYAANFPDLAAHGGNTPLMSGGVVTRYEYPPLSVAVGWLLHHVWAPLGEPWVASSLGLLALTIVVFFALPTEVRAVAMPVLLSLGLFDVYAENGFPVLIALPLLGIAVAHWTAIGVGGRLGRRGIVSAVALGLAAATHQLAWPIALLLVVALWRVRRGDLQRAATVTLLARYVGTAALCFAAVNGPFAVSHTGDWARALSSVFSQHAVPYGAGLVMLTVVGFGHSDALKFYSYATAALAVAMITITAVGIRRLAAAVPVFASVLFVLSVRSTAYYLVISSPVWLVWAASTDAAAVASSRSLRWPGSSSLLTTWPRRWAATAAALVPAVVLAGVALFSPASLRLGVANVVVRDADLHVITLSVRNSSGHDVEPHFYVDSRPHISGKWLVASGPSRLRPGQSAQLTLVPAYGDLRVVPHLVVYAVSEHPEALNSVAVRIASARVRFTPDSGTPAAARSRTCVLRYLAGADSC